MAMRMLSVDRCGRDRGICYGSCVMDVAYFYRSLISQHWLVTTIYFDAFSVFIIFSVKHVNCFRTKD